jgi:hypothetical protein
MNTVQAKRPHVNYWQCVWQAMQQLGWNLSHFAFQDEQSGNLRHLVRAHRNGQEFICSAPDLTEAVNLVFNQTRTSDSTPQFRLVRN